MGRNPPRAVGRNLRRLRQKAGLTKESLAKSAGVAVSTISMIELGSGGEPILSTVEKLAAVLGVTSAELLEDSGSLGTAAWLAAFEASPDAKVIRPPLTGEERAWLLSIPSAAWGAIQPGASTLRVLIEDRRLRNLPAK